MTICKASMLALESDIAIFGSTPLSMMSLMRAFLVGLATFVSFLSCMVGSSGGIAICFGSTKQSNQ